MASDFSKILAQKKQVSDANPFLVDLSAPPAGSPLKAPSGPAAALPQEVLKDRNAIRFAGPPGSTIWVAGKNTKNRFSANGEFVTSNPAYIKELRNTYGVREIGRVGG